MVMAMLTNTCTANSTVTPMREQGAEAVAGEAGDAQSVEQHHSKQSEDG